MSSYESVNETRAKNWGKNALLYRGMRIFRGNRDKNLWLFSAWEGQKYADNSKYLFEYMIKNHPEVTCIWQTRNQEVFDELCKSKMPVQFIGTKQALETQKEAGVIFYTNGSDDFGDFPRIYGAKIVALWHGVGFKKIYRELYTERGRLRRKISDLRWRFFSWVARDITIATSEASSDQFKKGFILRDKDIILIAGQPRNDTFSEKVEIGDIIQNKEILQKIGNKRIVLYMPTFRKNGNAMMRQLEKLWESESLSQILDRNDSVLLAKIHYLNQGKMASTNNKIMLNDMDVLDTQKLMGCSDILVTDYSSCAIDFALQNKPILFYFPDWNEYHAEDCMRKGTKEACSINCAESPEEFESELDETLRCPQKGLFQSQKLNQLFDETGVKPGEYSENVYKKVWEQLLKKDYL